MARTKQTARKSVPPLPGDLPSEDEEEFTEATRQARARMRRMMESIEAEAEEERWERERAAAGIPALTADEAYTGGVAAFDAAKRGGASEEAAAAASARFLLESSASGRGLLSMPEPGNLKFKANVKAAASVLSGSHRLLTAVEKEARTASGEEEEAHTCAICLVDLPSLRCKAGTLPVGIRALQCGHLFCPPCIETWVRKQGRTCPICRDRLSRYDRSIILGEAGSGGGGGGGGGPGPGPGPGSAGGAAGGQMAMAA